MNCDRDFTRCLHILKYTRRIVDKTLSITKSEFISNYEIHDLFSFWLFQISENAANLSEEFKQTYNHIPWRVIIRFRSIPAHHYEKVDLFELWDMIITDIPMLHEFVKQQQAAKDTVGE